MCGLVGTWLKEPKASPDTNQLRSMINLLKHRGPDHQQVWGAPGVGLSHARLSILDLNPRSNQPMEDEETGTVIVFNGEIYNYIELREELKALGHSFKTESDTEVIPKAYREWGVDCLSRFNGMWAFALYDRKSHRLFCARDRYGIKPFCYGTTASGDLVFASEHKALWTHFREFAKPYKPLLHSFMSEGTSFSAYEESLYKGIRHLKPSHYFSVGAGERVEQKSYYKVGQEPAEPLPSHEEAQQVFADLLEDSLRLRYRSDVPVGSCMSGGLDSPTLVGLGARIFESSLQTFSCVYPDHPSVDESAYIEENVRHFRTVSHTTTPTFRDFNEAVRRATWEQDGPTGGPSILSQRAVMKLARPEVRVLIDGQGADEVLGGYHHYVAHKIRTLIREFARSPGPATWRALSRDRKLWEKRTGKRSKLKLPKWVLRTWSGRGHKFKKVSGHFSSTLDQQNPFPWDDLNSMMLENLRISMVDLLHYEDRNSMAYSIETRLPFLDYRIVDFAFSLPHTYKIRGDQTKMLLHKIAGEILPAKVYNRQDKMGFSTPGQAWFQRKETGERIRHLFSEKEHSLYEFLSDKKLNKLKSAWKKCETGKALSFSDECGLWRLITTAAWLEMLAEDSFPPSAPAAEF